jgi:outer membrane protein assembly factor BamB
MRIVDDLENDFTELPDLTPAWTAIYPIYGDRLPRAKDKKPETTAGWVLVSNATGKISVPWSSEPGRSRSPGSVWYAAGEIASDADREVWVGIAAADHGKLWVNGRLVWTAEETMWRAYDKREAVLKIPLKKGVNRLLIRVREDRAWTWARFQVCVRGAPASAGAAAPAATAAAPAAPAAKMLDDRGDGYGRFPDAAPPLAWDLEKGINVAWKRVLDVKTSSGAVAVGERLFLRADPHTLLCLDARDGKTLWRQDACILELTDPAAFAKYQACATDAERAALLTTLRAPSSSAVCSPVTDGQTVWTCYSSGVVAAYDMDGKRRWLVRVNAAPGAMRVTDGLVLVEGGGPTATAHRLVALDAATGAEKWGRDLPGAYNRGSLNLLHVEGHGRARAMALTSDLAVVDPLTGQTLLSRADADSSEGSALYVADSDVFFGKLSKATGMRYFLDADGQVGCRFLFRSHYGIKYDRSTPCFALGPWFMVVCTVQEDCKGHSNAARRELYAYDRVTGMPIKRIKPVLDQAQVEFRPTSAGPYVFVQDSGGGSSGGRDDAGQFAVVRMDGSSRLLSWNLVPMGDADTPSFAGKRMFVRIRDTLYCFATLTEDGRRYERETAAKMLLADLRAAPADEAYPAPKPLAAAPDPAVVPAARFVKDIGLLEWITAGPFPFKPLAQEPGLEAKLAALSPALGASLEIGGRSAAFAAVALRQTSAIYTYGHSYYLCGIGGTTANLSATVDLTALTGGEPDSCVVLHTVVRNARDQIVTLMAPPTGVDLWFAGRKARAFDAYRLAPGYYPLLVRADPAVAGAKLSISFRPQDDPLAARQAWLLGLNAAEDDIRAIVRGLPNSPELAQAVGLLAELDGFKAELDLRRVARMAGNDGTGEFPLARPPVPWERGANLRWTATLPGAAGPGAVASGDRAFVAVAPATLACLSVAKGETLWTKPVGKSDAKNAVCAPAADAGRVFAVTALGEAVCLRAGDGSSVWSRELPEAAPPAFAALAGKVLVTQAGAVHGLDAATGRPLWTKKLPANAAGFAPVPLKIGAVPGILIGTGECLDAGDGRPLGSLPRPLSGSRPCRVGALLGLATADGKLVARPLPGGAAGGWEVAAGGRVTAGPVGAEGMVYAVIADAELLALRSVDGAMAWRQKLPAGGRDVRLALGGQRVFVCNLGADSRTVVLEPGDAYGTQWEYAVPGGVSEPFFLGRDAFVRAGDTLFCVGGAPPRDPGAFAEPATAAADAAFQPADGVPVVPFESNLMPAKWLVAAPFKPRTLETDLLVALGGRAKARPAPGTKVSAEGKEVEFRALAPTAVWRDPKFTGGLDAVDLVEPIGKDWNSTALLYTVLDNDAERIVEARVLTPGGIQWNAKDRLEAAIWVGGVRVVEGDLVRLPAGKVPVLIQAGVGELKTSGKIWMAPRFVDRTGDVAGQLEKLKARKAVWDAFRKSSSELAVLKK